MDLDVSALLATASSYLTKQENGYCQWFAVTDKSE